MVERKPTIKQLKTLDMNEYVDQMLYSPPALPTGYGNLDSIIKGFPSGCLTIIGARTRSGKSTFAYNIMLNVLENNPNKKVALYSYEVSKHRVITRLLTILTKRMSNLPKSFNDIDMEIKKHRDQYEKLSDDTVKAWELLKGYENRLLLCDDTSVSVEEICDYLKSNAGEIDCLFVDYTELVKVKQSVSSEEQRIAKIVTSFRELATALNIPVVVIAQINREYASRDKKEDKGSIMPMLEGLRYSGRQEQEASLVLFLANEFVELGIMKGEFETDLQVGVMKNRYGAQGSTIKLGFEMKSGNIYCHQDKDIQQNCTKKSKNIKGKRPL